MRRLLFILLFLIVYFTEIVPQNDFRVMFYNVENLFDTKNNPLKNDNDFLPDGFRRWTPWKYWEKLRNITRVITAVGGMQSPALAGLCEVENDSVLFDLTKRSPLRVQEYEYIVTDSPDERGINVALLYQRHQFRLIEFKEYEVISDDKNARPTRNILHATGSVVSGDTLDVFVCHFPSRSNGFRETEPARIRAASLLRGKTDTLFSLRKSANIIIMGDFNDNPNNKSISKALGAKSIHSPLRSDQLYNLFLHRVKKRNFGSYKYKGKWDLFDQFMVSGNMLIKNNGIQVINNEAHIYNAGFLLEDDVRYTGKKPYRTNLGPRYIGGFSDHLPVYMDLYIRE